VGSPTAADHHYDSRHRTARKTLVCWLLERLRGYGLGLFSIAWRPWNTLAPWWRGLVECTAQPNGWQARPEYVLANPIPARARFARPAGVAEEACHC